MIYLNGRPTVGFAVPNPPARSDALVDRALPPLELRTAYTLKGLGIGAGGLIGFLAFGPLGMVLLGCTGWYAGNRAAIRAERDFAVSRG